MRARRVVHKTKRCFFLFTLDCVFVRKYYIPEALATSLSNPYIHISWCIQMPNLSASIKPYQHAHRASRTDDATTTHTHTIHFGRHTYKKKSFAFITLMREIRINHLSSMGRRYYTRIYCPWSFLAFCALWRDVVFAMHGCGQRNWLDTRIASWARRWVFGLLVCEQWFAIIHMWKKESRMCWI